MEKLSISSNIKKRTLISLDPVNHEPVLQEMGDDNKHLYFFGETVGLLVFRPWYYCIAHKGHMAFMQTYDFPVRLSFVDDPFDNDGFLTGRADWKGWNLPSWIQAAQQMEEDGVRAILGGCGLTSNIQKELSDAVSIPFYSSTLFFIPEILNTLADDQQIGILTVSKEQLCAHNMASFRSCGIEDDSRVAIAGMNESEFAKQWLSMTTPEYDFEMVQDAVVKTAQQLINDHPNIATLVLECTDMPPYSDALRKVTGLPVFDPVDMVRQVHEQVK
jgi:Asp/Glu/hydantoin racemase